MKAYAEVKDYRRFVGIHFIREINDRERPHIIELAQMPEGMLTSIERALHWHEQGRDNCITGAESILLCIEEVQLVFDALWEAGIRPS